jgi:ABC-type dipeptide/oligopeptide/nickel transport system permease subunit
MVILGILNSAKISRIVKAKVDCLEKSDFIEAAKSFGISKCRLIIFHIFISNCLSIFIVQAFFQMIDVILIEIGFAYISSRTQGGRSSTPTFGNMLVFAIDNKNQSIVWLLSSGLAVFNILTFLNLSRILDNLITRRQGYGNLT